MKKIIKLVCSLFLAVSLFPMNKTFAEEVDTSDVMIVSQSLVAQYLSLQPDEEYDVDQGLPVYSLSEELQGAYFNLYQNNVVCGYAIVYSMNGILKVVEASTDGAFPYNLAGVEKLYYAGPFQYFYKSNEDFYHFETNEKVIIEAEYDEQNINLIQSANRARYVIQGEYYIDNLSGNIYRIDQHDNRSGTGNDSCFATTVAMIMMYWTNTYPNLTTTSQGNFYFANSLSNKIIDYIGHGKTNFSQAVSGMPNVMSFFGNKNNCTITYWTSELNNYTLNNAHLATARTEISNNRPMQVIVGRDGYRYSSDNILSGSTLHSLMVIGTKYCYTGSYDSYLTCVDPWNTNTVDIIWDTYNSSSRPYFAIYGLAKYYFN